MPQTITHFMWGYQPHFRINQESICKKLFPLLDERFIPQVFLVGVLAEENANCFPACVEPERDFWAESSDFNSVMEIAKEIRNGYVEKNLRHSHSQAQKWHDETLVLRSVQDAILQIIENSSARPSGFTYFVAYPAKVEGYLVSVVLGLQRNILREYPSLSRGTVPIHKYRSISVPRSLIDAVVKSYLDKASSELRLPEPGNGTSELNAEEIVRDGANRLMMGLAYRADSSCIEGWHGFLNSCSNIARTYYEGAEGVGTIVLSRKDHPSLKNVIHFQVSSKLGLTRLSRKILQLSSQKLALHTNSNELFGLVEIRQYEPKEEDLFTVDFLGHHHWQVLHNSQILMGVRYGQPYLPKPPFDENKLKGDLSRLFKNITAKQIDRILGLVREAEHETHGTMLVISSGAKTEADRLASECIPISPKTITPNVLRRLTSIDGAVLLNPKGTCYAVGVILDGMASEFGNPARGARYNSAIRYVLSSKFTTFAVIVSEDGGVDFLSSSVQ